MIGTEVPAPGGIQLGDDQFHVTDVEDVEETIGVMQDAFIRAGME